MNTFSFKTRGQCNPTGKQKVYFCCHSRDFTKYFTPISNQILELYDCAIWYPTEYNVPREENFYQDLKQMQLFILPVTENLIFNMESDLQKEIDFAKASGIPLLPIMEESGLEELFGKKFGDLHLLDANQQSLTALPFRKKLNTFLSAVLVNDNLTSEIKNSFDTLLFLSYRKKDRKFVKQLMETIHKDPEHRDLAIWYDEFLTPGENFNDSIGDALKKSNLFVLAVTPNVVNENNYIMSTEYPMAVHQGKTILPVEMAETDKTLLREKYNNIPPCIKISDTELLSSAIKICLGKETKELSPIQNYYMGIAYLKGVEVEVNYKYGLDYLIKASNQGITEATEEVAMFSYFVLSGEQAKNAAFTWQEKLISQLVDKYKGNPSSENLTALFNATIVYGDFHHATKKYEGAEKWYSTGLKLNEKSTVAHFRLGCTYEESGNFTKAISSYAKGIAVSHNQQDLMIGHSALGDLYYKLNNLSESLENYAKATKYASEINFQDHSAESRKNLADLLLKQGKIFAKKGDLNQSLMHFKQANSTFEALVSEENHRQFKASLGQSFRELGKICRKLGKKQDAENYIIKSIEIFQELVKDHYTYEMQENLAGAYCDMGDYYKSVLDKIKAEKYFLKSVEILEKVVEKTNHITSRQNLATVHMRLAELLTLEKPASAKEYYQKSIDLYLSLIEETDQAIFALSVAKAFKYMAQVLKTTGLFKEAQQALIRSAAYYSEVYKKDGKIDSLYLVYDSCKMIGDFYREQNNIPDSLSYYKMALVLCEDLITKDPSPAYVRQAAESYSVLGDLCLASNQPGEAVDNYEKSLAKYKTFTGKITTGQYRIQMADVAIKLSEITDNSKFYITLARDIYLGLCKDYPNAEKYKEKLLELEKLIF